MSSVVVMSPEDLAKLVREAVREAVGGFARIHADDDWIPAKASPIPRTTLDRLRDEGIVRSSKIGREVFVHRDDLRKWMEAQAYKMTAKKVEPAHVEPVDPFERARARAKRRAA